MAPLSDGDENVGGAVDRRFTAAFALILPGVGFAAVGLGAAVQAKSWIVERGGFPLDCLGDAIGGDRRMHVGDVIMAQLRARPGWRDAGH